MDKRTVFDIPLELVGDDINGRLNCDITLTKLYIWLDSNSWGYKVEFSKPDSECSIEENMVRYHNNEPDPLGWLKNKTSEINNF